jgi:hypothetical protein
MAVFWNFVPCHLVHICLSFRGAYSLNHHSDEYHTTHKTKTVSFKAL